MIAYTLQVVLSLLCCCLQVLDSRAQSEASCVDTIIFSYHRPMQLYALLESLDAHVLNNCGTTYVIYRADTKEYNDAYELVDTDFPAVVFLQQGENPAQDFKEITVSVLDGSSANYVMFVVDDMILLDTIDLSECVAALEATNAYGFYVRLGKNLTDCYLLKCDQPLPAFQAVGASMIAWSFDQARYDWNYPNTLDMTLYRKKDIESAFSTLSYPAPNILELYWHQQGITSGHAVGLCYTKSRAVNIPSNQVQTAWYLPHMQEQSAQDLLRLFLEGKKIALDDLYKIVPVSVHMDYRFRFIDRFHA